MGLADLAVNAAISGMLDKFVNPKIAGIGKVKKLWHKDNKFYATVVLDDLEDNPIDIEASDIKVAPDYSSVTVGKYEANKAFAKNALNKFATKPIPVPDGATRLAFSGVAKMLKLG